MTNITTRLQTLGMGVNENFLVQFILNLLLSEYGLLQISYNTMKDKWNVHELHSMLVQEETRLKNQGIHSMTTGKKLVKKNDKGKKPLKINDDLLQIQKKVSKGNDCHLCGKFGHFKKDYPKRKSWFEKKGELNAHGYFESNLTEVPHNTWWINSRCTNHVSNTMQGFLII